MKKILVLIILVCLMLSSCQKPEYEVSIPVSSSTSKTDQSNNSEQGDVSEDEFVFIESDDDTTALQNDYVQNTGCIQIVDGNMFFFADSNVYKYNERTGSVVSLCSDPLCDHKTEDCPFYSSNTSKNTKIYDNFVYFRRKVYDKETDSYIESDVRLSIENNKLEILRKLESENIFSNRLYYKNYCYYYYLDFNEEEEEYEYVLKRQNLDTKEIVTLYELGNLPIMITGVIDDKIYWFNVSEQKFYYSKNDDLSDKNFVYEGEIINPAYFDGDLYYISGTSIKRMSLSDNSIIDTGIEADNKTYFMITNKYIYYCEINFTDGAYDNKIYRTDHSGGNKEFILQLSEIMPNCGIRAFFVKGNYIYAFYYFFDKDNALRYSTCDSDLLRINIDTKEIYHITPDN